MANRKGSPNDMKKARLLATVYEDMRQLLLLSTLQSPCIRAHNQPVEGADKSDQYTP